MDACPAHVQWSPVWSSKKQTNNITETDRNFAKCVCEREQEKFVVEESISIDKQACGVEQTGKFRRFNDFDANL
jgi:hypothetical protein